MSRAIVPYQKKEDCSLFQTDTLVYHDYLKTVRRTDGLEPEARLMLGVLEDAVYCFQKYVFAEGRREKRHFQEAQQWILAKDSDWTFSFGNVCNGLGLDPDYLRGGLLRWKRHQVKGHGRGRADRKTIAHGALRTTSEKQKSSSVALR